MEETLEIIAGIPGGKDLADWLLAFGYNHGFGDDEVMSLTLNRESGSTLVLMSRKRDGKKWYSKRVTFRFAGMVDAHIEGFSHQNVIGGLNVRRLARQEIHPSLLGIGVQFLNHQIAMEPCAGAFGTINCNIGEIRVEPLPQDEI